jgi:predicted cobalt transporter CbtA
MTLNMRTLLVWGLLAGLIGGVLAFGFASAFGEPPVEVAISLEEQGLGHDHAGAEPAEAEAPSPVSRGTQSTVGLALATCLFGVALGGLFALAFAFAYGRIGALTPRGTALVTAAVGFGAAFLVPYLTYPPNPPAVGHEDTIEERTALYFTMMAISVAVAIVAIYASRRLAEWLDRWLAVIVAGVGYVAIVATVGAVLPHFHEVPEGFPAQTLWEFRLASLGTQVVLWAAIGVTFAVLLDRSAQRATKRPIDSGIPAG